MKRVRLLRVLVLLALCILFFQIVSGADYEQGIHLIRPDSEYITHDYSLQEYLSVEDLTFMSCLEDDNIPIRPSVMCLETNTFEDLEAIRWTAQNNCYVSSFNLEQMPCNSIRLQAEYTVDGENLRLYKDVRVNKLSKVLDQIIETQYNDGGWMTTKDTAYGIWALSHFPDIFDYEIERALDWLKLERNEDEKCWPKAPCDIPLTMEILYTLTLSGFDDAKRTVNDARNWIENKQNFYEQNDEWSVKITPIYEDTQMVLIAVDRDVIDKNFSISEPRTYSFEAEMDDTLYAISYDNFKAVIKNQYGEPVLEYQGNNLSFEIKGACWSKKKKSEPCDNRATSFASLLDLHNKNLREAKRYMFSEITFSDTVGIYYGNRNDTSETALFLISMFNLTDSKDLADYTPYMERYKDLSDKDQYDRYMDEVKDWLLFKQNNEGSWGIDNATITEKAYYSAYGVLALKRIGMNRTFEPIEDAEEWLSKNEYNITSNNTVSLASAFSVLENNARPLLTIKPGVVQIEQPVIEIEVYNPTMFTLDELDYNISSSLKDFITIEEKKKISAYSYRKMKIEKIASPKEDLYGFISIHNLGDEIARIPVLITDYPTINISAQDTATVFGKRGSIDLSATKSNHEFVCTMNWDSDEILTPGSFKITGDSQEMEFAFDQAISKEDLYTGILSCKARGYDFTIPISTYLTRYSSYPITLSPKSIYVNKSDDDILFYIKNNLDREINPTITFSTPQEFFKVIPSLSLNPNEERNVTILNLIPPEVNYSDTFEVEVSVFKKIEKLPIVVDVTMKPVDSVNLFLIIFIFFLITAPLAAGGYIAYRYREQIKNYFNKFNKFKIKEDIKTNLDSLHKLKSDDRVDSIINMIQILKFQKKPDDSIKERLQQHFSDEEIQAALTKGGISLSSMEQQKK